MSLAVIVFALLSFKGWATVPFVLVVVLLLWLLLLLLLLLFDDLSSC